VDSGFSKSTRYPYDVLPTCEMRHSQFHVCASTRRGLGNSSRFVSAIPEASTLRTPTVVYLYTYDAGDLHRPRGADRMVEDPMLRGLRPDSHTRAERFAQGMARRCPAGREKRRRRTAHRCTVIFLLIEPPGHHCKRGPLRAHLRSCCHWLGAPHRIPRAFLLAAVAFMVFSCVPNSRVSSTILPGDHRCLPRLRRMH
jgi:hypothetical protein